MLGVVLALVWIFVLRDPAEPVSVAEAVETFRAGDAAAGTDALSGRPAPGVYVYATDGFEEIDALLGARHDYPTETTITVSHGGCGVLLRWDALDARSTTWELCPGEVWSIAGYDELHRFLGQTERTSYRCESGSTWRPASEAAGTPVARRCTTGESTEAASGQVLGRESRTVGGQTVETVHVSLDLVLDGRTRGTGSLELWLEQSTGLIVRLALENDNRSESAIGDVGYRERATLDLLSLEPRT